MALTASFKENIANPTSPVNGGIPSNQPMTDEQFSAWSKPSVSTTNSTTDTIQKNQNSPVNKILSSGEEGFKGYSDDILKSTSEPLENAMTDVNNDEESSMSGKQNALGAGLDMAGDIAKGTVGAIGGAVNAGIVKPISNLFGSSPTLQKIATSKYSVASGLLDKLDEGTKAAVDGWNNFAQHNPNAAKKLADAGNIAQWMALFVGDNPEVQSKATDLINKSITGVSDTAKSLSDTAKETVESVKNAKNDISNARTTKANAKALNQSVQDTMPLQSKNVRVDELRNSFPDSGQGKGGITREGIMGKSTPQPTTDDISRGTTAHEYIKGESDPVTKIQNLNQGIKETSEGTNKFLDEKSSHANFEDMRNYMESKNTPPENIQKDPTASEAYKRSTENALNTLYKTMKETSSKTGDFEGATPGSDIRQARIAVDQQISKELGEETFGSPQYKGIKAAEVNARNVMNRMSEDMVRYPGQLEQVNKYNEFVDTLRSRNPDVNISPEHDAELKEKFGLKSTPESEAAAQKLSDQHTKMSKLYEARDNMIDRYQSSVGKDKWQEFLKNNPKIRKIIKWTLITGGAGLVGHEL